MCNFVGALSAHGLFADLLLVLRAHAPGRGGGAQRDVGIQPSILVLASEPRGDR